MRQPAVHNQQSRQRLTPTSGVLFLLGLLLLSACGSVDGGILSGPQGTAVAVAVEPTFTPTPLPTATATPRPTATATPRPTATATVPPLPPTATTAPPPPSAPPSARPPTVPPVATGGYLADWSTWFQGEDNNHQYRRSYDQAANEYRIAMLVDDLETSFYAPEEQKFLNFTLELDARRVAGPDSLGYGLVFRRQPLATSNKASERYIFYVSPQGLFSFFKVNTDGTSKTLKSLGPGPAGAIKVSNATNHLTVVCQGGTITLKVNNVTVHEEKNAVIMQPGEIGIFILAPSGTSGTDVGYKNLRLTPLP